jgi:hypothetical protein
MLVLLLATGVALAEDTPKAKSGNSAGQAREKTTTAAQKKAKAEAEKKAKAEAEEKAKAEAQKKLKEEAQPTTVQDPGAKQDPSASQDPKAKDNPDLGMSILGNQEAPKALVIVPWKQSEMGNALGISTLLDDSRQPIDKEVFMRMLSYYDIRSETAPHVGAPAAGRETAPAERKTAQPASAAHRRKP